MRWSGVRRYEHVLARPADHDFAGESLDALDLEISEIVAYELPSQLDQAVARCPVATGGPAHDRAVAAVDDLVCHEAVHALETGREALVDPVHDVGDLIGPASVLAKACEHGPS